jgi:hypothetical protein
VFGAKLDSRPGWLLDECRPPSPCSSSFSFSCFLNRRHLPVAAAPARLARTILSSHREKRGFVARSWRRICGVPRRSWRDQFQGTPLSTFEHQRINPAAGLISNRRRVRTFHLLPRALPMSATEREIALTDRIVRKIVRDLATIWAHGPGRSDAAFGATLPQITGIEAGPSMPAIGASSRRGRR